MRVEHEGAKVMRKVAIAVLSGAMVALIVAVFGGVGSKSARVEDVDRLREELAELKKNAAAQSGRLGVKSLLQQVQRSEADPEAEDSARSEQQATVESSDGAEAAERAKPVSQAEALGRIQDRFQGETRDMAWAPQASQLAHAQVVAHLPQGSQVRQLECRETLCRVETVHANLEAYRTFMRDAAAVGGEWLGPKVITLSSPMDAARLESVAYLVRPGHDFASLLALDEDN